MTAPSDLRRAGGDSPHRRPVRRRPAWMRVAFFALSVFVALGLLSGVASAQTTPTPTPPPLPTNVGPGSVKPPPPPVLPGKKGNKGGQKGKKGKGGNRKGKGSKGGSGLKASCAAFEFVQTYSNWGPALSYGRPVTVSYTATRCSKPRGRSLDLSVEGTATMHEVPLAGGELIESKPFSVSGTWRRPANAEGWPPPWWSCGVAFAQYAWEIADIYTFSVSADQGTWGLNVTSQGPTPKTVTWSYNAC